jgi:hypothetical protein
LALFGYKALRPFWTELGLRAAAVSQASGRNQESLAFCGIIRTADRGGMTANTEGGTEMTEKNILSVVKRNAPGPNTLAKSPDEGGKVAGFWRGLWHGSIAPITFIVSLFNPNVQIYEVHNNGAWYNLGYLLGMAGVLGGGRGGASRQHKQN